MGRYAVVSQSTDLRDRRTYISFTNSKNKALASANKRSGDLTYGEHASEVRNWHHTFKRVFELPSGWRKPTEQKLREQARKESTSSYPVTALDVLACLIRDEGKEIK